MKITSYPEIMTPAFKLIEKHAPNTHEAMLNAYWPCTAVKDMDDMIPLQRSVSLEEYHQILHVLSHSEAITAESSTHPEEPPPPVALNHKSWFHLPHIYNDAVHEGVDPTRLLATVAVHEWQHRRGYLEREAYDAGIKFAFNMGESRIASMHETARNIALERESHEDALEDLLRRLGSVA